jgi:large subunit ribosomal protein L28
MARLCEVCGKTVVRGHLVSHSNIKTNRSFSPNIQRLKVKVDGAVKRLYVCTACIRSGKVERAV